MIEIAAPSDADSGYRASIASTSADSTIVIAEVSLVAMVLETTEVSSTLIAVVSLVVDVVKILEVSLTVIAQLSDATICAV